MSLVRTISLLVSLTATTAWAANCATTVIEYVHGSGATYDPITRLKYDNPSRALGPPTVDSTGDNREGGTGWVGNAVPVVPVYPAFRSFELVEIGGNGRLVLRFEQPVFDDDLNPCGIDFVVYGNTALSIDGDSEWQNGDPNLTRVLSAVEPEPALVSVSEDGVTWYDFASPTADNFAPTLGRIYDPAHPAQTLANNQWWGEPTDPTYPLGPGMTLESVSRSSVADVARRYGWSAGGTGFDLRQLGVPFPNGIQYVRIANPATTGPRCDIDAVVAVAPRLVPDFDCDSDVDADDISFFLACATGPGMGPPTPECKRADFDRDTDVDQVDFSFVQRCYSGSGALVDLDCAN